MFDCFNDQQDLLIVCKLCTTLTIFQADKNYDIVTRVQKICGVNFKIDQIYS